jgi:hypothetical protein
MYENQIMDTEIRCACLRASNDGLLKVRCLYTHVIPSMYENQILDTEIRRACSRASNDSNAGMGDGTGGNA